MTIPKKVLLIEDQEYNYKGMIRELEKQARDLGIPIEITHIKSRNGALQKLRDQAFDVVSIDMLLPIFEAEPNGRMMDTAGAEIAWRIEHFSLSTPYLLYSSHDKDEVKKNLLEYDVQKEVSILRKDSSCGHSEWAKKLLNLISS